MQQTMKLLMLGMCVFLSSCTNSVEPTESDLGFADVLDVRLGTQPNQVTCLVYVQEYNGCQEARIVNATQADNVLEMSISTFQTTKSGCDTTQSVKKLWHTFSNLREGATVSVRIRADHDSRTNKRVDTLLTVAVP